MIKTQILKKKKQCTYHALYLLSSGLGLYPGVRGYLINSFGSVYFSKAAKLLDIISQTISANSLK